MFVHILNIRLVFYYCKGNESQIIKLLNKI